MTDKRFSTVIGNHDLMLRRYWNGENVELKAGPRDTHKKLRRKKDKYLQFLNSLPFMIDLDTHLVVHAGLRPNVELHSQTTGDLTRIRVLGPDRESEEGIPWYHVYNGDKTVIFGHWPAAEPRRGPESNRSSTPDASTVIASRRTSLKATSLSAYRRSALTTNPDNSLLRISISPETKESKAGFRLNAGFARSHLDLLAGGINAGKVREQKAAPGAAFIFHDHSEKFWIEVVRGARFGRGKYIDGIFQVSQFVCAHRRKSGVAGGRADRVQDDFFGQSVFHGIDRPDATAQLSRASLDRNEATGANRKQIRDVCRGRR
jgi:hypothetical protein